jgi:carbon monoxide dehydrogenase subunit G
MQIQQRFVVGFPRATVWDYFGRMDEVARCMPGASLTEPAVGNHAKFSLNIKLGPIAAAFAGESEVERDDANFAGVIRGNARDTRGDSRVKGVVEYRLSEEVNPAGTGVDISVEFSLTGRLAQFGRAGIVNDIATRFTADFAKNLAAALAAEAAPVAASPTSSPGSDASPAPPRSQPSPDLPNELNAGRLIASVLWGRIKAFLKSIFGRG